MKRNIFFIIIFLTILAVLLFKPVFASDTVVIRVWAMGAEGEKIDRIAREFESLHPNVKVICQTIPWGEAHAKLTTAFVGGQTPDIAQMGTTWTYEFKAMEALHSLLEYIEKDNYDTSVFLPSAWKTVAFDNGVYGIPWYVETRCLFYRKDCFSSAGIHNPPKNWQQLEETGRKLAQSPDKFAILLPERDEQSLLPFIWQAGGRLLDDNGRPAVNDKNTLRALSFYVKLFEDNIAPRSQMKDVDVIQTFAEENPPFSMFISGPWMKAQIDEKAPQIKDRWAVAPLPSETFSSSYLGGCQLVLFKTSKNPDIAWEFIKFANTKEMQVEWFKETGSLPSRMDAWDDPVLQGESYLKAFRTQLETAQPPPSLPEWEQIADAISRRMEQAVRKQVTPEESLLLLNNDMETILKFRLEVQTFTYKILILCSTALLIIFGIFLYFRKGYVEDKQLDTRSRNKNKNTYNLWIVFFLFPAMSIMTVFLFLPLIVSFLMSLTNYDIYSIANFNNMNVVGLENYHKVINDSLFWKSVLNTLKFAAVGGPLTIGISLLAAMGINKMTRMRAVYLLGLFLPVVTTLVAVAIVWKWIYHPRFGLLNALLMMFSVSPRDWLSNPDTALWALTAMAVWKNFGYTMVILLAGIQSIPQSYYEAAEIDGAGLWTKFRHITIPLLMPTMFLVTIMTTIGYLQFFAEPYVMTGGGPVDSTISVVLYLYQKGFKFYLLGEASAVSFVLFLIIFMFSIAQIHMGRKSETNS